MENNRTISSDQGDASSPRDASTELTIPNHKNHLFPFPSPPHHHHHLPSHQPAVCDHNSSTITIDRTESTLTCIENNDNADNDNDNSSSSSDKANHNSSSSSNKENRKRTAKYAQTICALLRTAFPILEWLPAYRWTRWTLFDISAGVTVTTLAIPQGLAYGRLAGVAPIYGMYVSLFPMLIYSVVGTSRQISIGTFAVVSIACHELLQQYGLATAASGVDSGSNLLSSDLVASQQQQPEQQQQQQPQLTAIELLTAFAMLIGIIQLLAGLLKLGALAVVLSDALISSFVVGSSIHVFNSQLFGLLGISSAATTTHLAERSIPFSVIRTWYRILSQIDRINLWTVTLSALLIGAIVLYRYGVGPAMRRRYSINNFPLPIDIICIIAATIAASIFDFERRFSIEYIEQIDAGFEQIPIVPRFDLLPGLLKPAIILAMIIYVSTYSLEKSFAAKHGYTVNPNQELIALGAANFISSFLLCYPCSGSLSRSVVQNKIGGKTQLTSIVAAALVLCFIFYLSPYLATLPKCCLSCIIVVALWGSLKKAREFCRYWQMSKWDGSLWMSTFVAVVLLGIANGLIVGIIVSLIMLVIRVSIPVFHFKYHIPGTEIYVSRPIPRTASAELTIESIAATDGIIAFEYYGTLTFINCEQFRRRFQRYILAPIARQQSIASTPPKFGTKIENVPKTGTSACNRTSIIHTVVFDCGHLSHVDLQGAHTILTIASELRSVAPGARLILAAVDEPLRATLRRFRFFDSFDSRRCCASVHEAIVTAAAAAAVIKSPELQDL